MPWYQRHQSTVKGLAVDRANFQFRRGQRRSARVQLKGHCSSLSVHHIVQTFQSLWSIAMVVYYQIAGRKVGSHIVRTWILDCSLSKASSSSTKQIERYRKFFHWRASLCLQLAIATLGATFGGSWLAMRGGNKKQQGPPINASSKEEEQFIQYVHGYSSILWLYGN
jgi:F-type H+-transporting ATPase subunit k